MSDIKVKDTRATKISGNSSGSCECGYNANPDLQSYENGKAAPRSYKSPKVPNTTIEGHNRGNGQ